MRLTMKLWYRLWLKSCKLLHPSFPTYRAEVFEVLGAGRGEVSLLHEIAFRSPFVLSSDSFDDDDDDKDNEMVVAMMMMMMMVMVMVMVVVMMMMMMMVMVVYNSDASMLCQLWMY